MIHKFYLQGLVIAVSSLLFCSCQDSNDDLSDFVISDGFDLTLVASEPHIMDPVDMEFDEKGNAFVLEMPGYPYEDRESRVIQLIDANHDGLFEDRRIYADQLELASSIMPYKGGLLVAAPPYLLFIKDSNHDGRADLRDTIMSGFSTGNLQHNYNGLSYGLDTWIYAANGGNSGKPFWWGEPSTVMDLRGDDFRFDPERRIMERVGESSGGFELAFDEWGRIFETHNLEHISQLVFPSRYSKGILLRPAHGLLNVSDHDENGLSRIYPIGEQETRVNHPEQAGYFSGACGITYYGGQSLGDQLNGSVWIADVVLNLVHVDLLTDHQSYLQASRLLEGKDFLACRDRSFRPVNLTVGPNGELYVIDMYREVIEHPEWIPDDIEETLDLNAGKDKGRIYRISKDDYQFERFDFEQFSSFEGLLGLLDHKNQWVRLTAQRLLMDHKCNDEEIKSLQAFETSNAYKRLHQLWVLQGKNMIEPGLLINALNDRHPGILENALIIAENYLDNHDIVEQVIDLLTYDHQRIRMQAALSLSLLPTTSYAQFKDSIEKALIQSSRLEMDEWNISAYTILNERLNGNLIEKLANEKEVAGNMLASMAYSVQGKSRKEQVLKTIAESSMDHQIKIDMLDALSENSSPGDRTSTIAGFITKIENNSTRAVIAACGKLRHQLDLPPSQIYLNQSRKSLELVLDQTLNEQERVDHLNSITLLPYKMKKDVLYQLLSNKELIKLQEDALRQLWESDHDEIGSNLVELWNDLGPQARKWAGDILLYKKAHHDALLTGLENETINIGEMNFDLERRRTLLWWTDDENTKRRAEALFSDSGVVNRKEAIHNMQPALALQGKENNGSKIFDQLCAECHVYKSSGKDVGPVLTEINRKSKESLIHDILDPNAAVDTRYINHQVTTLDGTLHIGMIESESDDDVVVKKMGGQSVRISKGDIETLKSLGTSLMMEGLEANMTHQDMADLLAFLQKG